MIVGKCQNCAKVAVRKITIFWWDYFNELKQQYLNEAIFELHQSYSR